MDEKASEHLSDADRNSTAFFVIGRPDLAKSYEEKKHRELLHKFILSIRNGGDDKIKELLHNES